MSIILGIETSCDDTGIAIYDESIGIIANELYSQVDMHKLYGGVVPELASRDHLSKIIQLLLNIIKNTRLSLNALDAISYTNGPGLNGALLVGASLATSLAYALKKPIIPIHHLEGHLLSPLLINKNIPVPFIAFIISGGHTQLVHVKEIGRYEIIGDTLDDAAGEAFDKTAKMLDINYPGGKELARLAKDGKIDYNLPRPMISDNSLNMSFSGLKTATNTLINKIKKNNLDNILLEQDRKDVARSVESAITDVIVAKAIKASTLLKINTIVISGGVSSNESLRFKFNQHKGVNVFYPPLDYCTDNAAMIAFAGYTRLKEAQFNYTINVKPRWSLESILTL